MPKKDADCRDGLRESRHWQIHILQVAKGRQGVLEWQTMYNTAESRLNKLFELYYNGAITKNEFSTRKETLIQEKQKAKEHLETHGQA